MRDAKGWRVVGVVTVAAVQVDELKTVHMTASACTAMFTNGIADAKIAIEKMTVEQSIDFMRGVVGNTLRDPARQFFSAAFNLFTPISFNNGTTVSAEVCGVAARWLCV